MRGLHEGVGMIFPTRLKLIVVSILFFLFVLTLRVQSQTSEPTYGFKIIWQKDISKDGALGASFIETTDAKPPIILLTFNSQTRKAYLDSNGENEKHTDLPENDGATNVGYELWPQSSVKDRFIVYKFMDEAINDMQLQDKDGKVIKDLKKGINANGKPYFSPKGNYFALVGPDLKFFDNDGNLLSSAKLKNPDPDAFNGSFSPDEKYFGLMGQGFQLWKTNGELVLEFPLTVNSVGFSLDDSIIILTTLNELVAVDQQGKELFRRPFAVIKNVQFFNNHDFIFNNNNDLWFGDISTQKIILIKHFDKPVLGSVSILDGNILLDYGKKELINPKGKTITSIDIPGGMSINDHSILVLGNGLLTLLKLEKI
jgi:hypothetical protein